MLQESSISLESMLEKFAADSGLDIEDTREQLDATAQQFVTTFGDDAWLATVILERAEVRAGNPNGAAKWILLGKRIREGGLVPSPPLRMN